MLALLNTSDNEYAAILGEDELHQLYKDDNDETASHVRKINGNDDVEFGALNAIIYIIINDEKLLEKGHMLEIDHEDGAFSSELFRSEQDPFFTLYDSSELVDASVENAQLNIYDSHGNLIYQESLEE